MISDLSFFHKCGLMLQVTQAELHCQFHALGAGVIEEVRVQRDKGFGFVRYNTHEEAALAIQMANGRIVRGKAMKVRNLPLAAYLVNKLIAISELGLTFALYNCLHLC